MTFRSSCFELVPEISAASKADRQCRMSRASTPPAIGMPGPWFWIWTPVKRLSCHRCSRSIDLSTKPRSSRGRRLSSAVAFESAWTAAPHGCKGGGGDGIGARHRRCHNLGHCRRRRRQCGWRALRSRARKYDRRSNRRCYRRIYPPNCNPSLKRFDFGPILGQAIVAIASGALLTVIAAVKRGQRRR